METEEYHQQVIEDDSEVIVDKTSRSRGPAQVVIKMDLLISKLLQQYCDNIRSTTVGQNTTLQNCYCIMVESIVRFMNTCQGLQKHSTYNCQLRPHTGK